MRGEPVRSDNTYFPYTGSPKAIVVLAAYQDITFILPNFRRLFQQLLGGEGYPQGYGHGEDRNASGIRQYFKDMSFGAFCPQSDVYSPVTLPYELVYYGGADPNGGGKRFIELIIDAYKLMDNSLDFSAYNASSDSYVDLMYVAYAGHDQNMGAKSGTVWPKARVVYPIPTVDGKIVYRSGIDSGLIGNEKSSKQKMTSGIDLFYHGFSHCMGLFDFYPTFADSGGDNQRMEIWSLMDDSEYAAGGWCPTAYMVWEREAMGRISIEELQDAQ